MLFLLIIFHPVKAAAFISGFLLGRAATPLIAVPLGLFALWVIINLLPDIIGYVGDKLTDDQINASEYNDVEVLRSGLEGETYALKMLSKLSDEYHIFTNTIITYDGKQSETDVIVVGPTGIFIVDVKNYKGTICGGCDDQSLVHIKTKGESEYVYNPLKQVSTHVYRLANFLRDKGIQCWVNGGVFFTNDALTLEIDGDTEQCRKYMHSCLELTSWIKENGSSLSEDVVNRIVSCIASL